MIRFILSSGFAAIFLAAPAFAQVYKWVDERGVVNYSSEAPAHRTSTVLDPKSVRVSTYTSDDAQKRTVTTLPSAGESVLSEKIDRLERKLDAERYARQSLMGGQIQAGADSWYDQCARDRRVDCDYAGADPYYYGSYYGPVVVAGRPHAHPHPNVRKNATPPKPVGSTAFAPARSMAPRQM